MSDIFISYAKRDRRRVAPLADELSKIGWSIWWDPALLPGDSWPDTIEREIKDCRAMVVVWTTSSVTSRWVRNEAREGAKIDALIPVALEPVEIPLEFRDIQAADLTTWEPRSAVSQEFQNVVTSLERRIGRPNQPQTRPGTKTLGRDTDLALGLQLGGDLGSTDSRDLTWIQNLVDSMGSRAVPHLLAALEDPDPARRGHAAFLLGRTGDASVVPALVPLLDDRSGVGIGVDWLPTVRRSAALALRTIGTRDALLALAEAFE